MALLWPLISRSVPQGPSATLRHGTTTWITTSVRCLSGAKEIPGPKALPGVGILFSMISDKDFDKNKIHLYFKKLIKTYGPIVKLQIPGQLTMVLLSQPEDIKTVHQFAEGNPMRGGLQALKKARSLDEYYGGKGGIAAEDGEEWWRVRTNVQGTVMKLDNIRHYLSDMDRTSLDLLDRISKEKNEKGELTSDIKTLMAKWAIECVCLISLNRRLGCLDPELPPDSEQMRCFRAAQSLMNSVFECEQTQLWKFYRTKSFRTMQESLKILTEVCDKTLRELKEGIEKQNTTDSDRSLCMIEQLLLKPHLSHKDVVTFMIDLIPGGTETVMNSGMVLLYLLAKHPHIQAKVQAEVDSVIGSQLSPITARQLNQLSYIRAVMKESHRVLPPAVGINRILQDDVELKGYVLRKGWNCLMLSSLAGWDEAQFARPQEFIPERWLRHRPLGQIHPYASLPFSHGIRMCIGRRIMEQETLQRYNLAWRGEDLQRNHVIMFDTVGPYHFTFTERN
ncbi:probable cytochrome P450 301a1, mitochondrial isoform X2 [Penaeus japonicus]|uniref:probable cytochrome P450 301a1, mitochondrial isoform X2 n=1 Tax=Penaeus japonicus TaxID=27405 RepID=UPI001C70CCA3|nr:probable cytochrome P450 301a1, mitochondrial isoform X2 [Penaeus japonicus]